MKTRSRRLVEAAAAAPVLDEEVELLECPCQAVPSEAGAVDRAASVIKGVKLMGLESPSKKRAYDPGALREAVPLYEGAAVYLNHSHGERDPAPKLPPSPANMIAVVRGARFVEGDGLRGDLHLSPTHPYTGHVMWFAESAPHRLGMSHDAAGMTQVVAGKEMVRKITKVRSVDLVTDPATTAGLFESRERGIGGDRDKPKEPPPGAIKMEVKDLTENMIAEQRPDLLKTIREKALAECASSEAAKAEKKELEELRLERKLNQRKTLVETKLKESKLPEVAITDEFRQTLLEAKDDAEVERHISDRKKLVESFGTKGGTPAKAGVKSREGKLTESAQPEKDVPEFKDSKEFASAFKRC